MTDIATKLANLSRGDVDPRTRDEDRITPEGISALKKAIAMTKQQEPQAAVESYQALRRSAGLSLNQEREALRREAMRNGRQKRIDTLMQKAAIPKRFRGKVLEDILSAPWGRAQEELAKDLQVYLDEDYRQGKSAVIWGDKGTGKSQAVCALLGTLSDMGEAVLYTRADFFVMQIESKQENVLHTYSQSNLVVIDELFSHDDELRYYNVPKNKIQAGYVAQLIDACYQEEVPVIIISNRTYDDIEAFLGGPTIDRLKEAGSFIIKVTGPSLRTQSPDLRLVK